MNSKIRMLLKAGSLPLSLFVAGSAIAAAPGGGGFGQYTVSSGVITDTMTGTTAASVTMASGNGFLQQKVTTAEGVFYRTIILDSNATATNAAGVNALGFRNETFVDTVSNSGNMASDGRIAFSAPAGVATAGSGSTSTVTLAGVTMATNSMVAVLARGDLATTGTIADIKSGVADATGIKILQAHDFGVDTDASGTVTAENTGKSGAMAVNFQFLSQGEAAAQDDRSNFMRLDEGRYAGVDTPTDMTVRRSSGDFTVGSGVLTLPNGQTLAYVDGDDVAVSLVDNGSLGGGTFGYPTTGTAVGNAGSVNANIQAQTFRNYTTGDVASYVNSSLRQVATNGDVINGGLTGYPQVLFSPVVTASVASAWPAANWNTGLFGTAPVVVVTNSTNAAADIAPTSMTQAFPQ
jgi:hypothetical protein